MISLQLKQEYLIELLKKNKGSLKQIEVWDKLMNWALVKSNELHIKIIEYYCFT